MLPTDAAPRPWCVLLAFTCVALAGRLTAAPDLASIETIDVHAHIFLRRQERYRADFAYFAGSGEIAYEGRTVQAPAS